MLLPPPPPASGDGGSVKICSIRNHNCFGVFLLFFSTINILDVSSCPQAGTFSGNLPQAVCHDQFYSCIFLILFFAHGQKGLIHLHLSICSFSHRLDFNFMLLFLAAHLLLLSVLFFFYFFVSWHIPPGSDPFGSICTHIPIVFVFSPSTN